MNIKNKKGITLTELIIASILMGIIMVGTISFSSVIKKLRSSTSNSTIIEMYTTGAMGQISRHASLATGNGNDMGVYTNAAENGVCFRNDTQNTPSIYSDDPWHCYEYLEESGKKYIQYCKKPSKNDGGWSGDPHTDASCESSWKKLIALAPTDNSGGTTDNFFNMSYSDGKFEYINIYIRSIYDPDKAENEVSNPAYYLETSISPTAHSR